MKSRRLAVDAAMVVLLPMLMAYSLIGERFHEAAGTLMLCLFAAHHRLNRGWFKGLLRGRYTARRIFQTSVDLLLLIFMVLQPITGILMSKHLYSFLPTANLSAAVRAIHLPLANWGFLLMCVHAGTHLEKPLRRLPAIGKAALGLIAAYGGYAFVKRQIPFYMFLKTSFVFFDFNEPRVFFFLDYLAVMILFAMLGWGIVRVLRAALES
jgi:hypothetical protein